MLDACKSAFYLVLIAAIAQVVFKADVVSFSWKAYDSVSAFASGQPIDQIKAQWQSTSTRASTDTATPSPASSPPPTQ